MVINNTVAEFLHSIFDSVPMKTIEEVEMTLRCHPVTKQLKADFDEKHSALFNEFAVSAPKNKAGKGGGKLRASDMEPQVPQERKAEYQDRFLVLANMPVELVLEERDMKTLKDTWIKPEWLIARVERFAEAGGFPNVTYQKVLMQCIYALQDSKKYVEPETPATQGEEATDDGSAGKEEVK